MSEVVEAYKDEDFCIKLEQKEGILFVHCDVDNYSKTVRKNIEKVFEDVKEACRFFGWEAIHAYTPNPKFAKLMKGGFTIDTIDYNGEEYEVVRWELV